MRLKTAVLLLANLVLLDIGLLVCHKSKIPKVPNDRPQIVVPQEPTKPIIINIGIKDPVFLTYNKTIQQMQQWEKEAPDFVEVETYGKTEKGTPLYYLRLNHKDSQVKPKVLIMSSIHGNEPLASSVCLRYVGNILTSYGKDDEITKLVDSRDIYFVPVVSPDSFPKDDSGRGMQRYVEGVDPNRDFPTKQKPNKQSIPTVKAIQDLFAQKGFDAAISGHTYGRLFLKPWGDSVEVTAHDEAYKSILGDMSQLSGYRIKPCSAIYGKPIIGTEVDWFYRHGAFAIVIEYGTHQRVPLPSEIDYEFGLTYKAVLKFIDKAPLVNVKLD